MLIVYDCVKLITSNEPKSSENADCGLSVLWLRLFGGFCVLLLAGGEMRSAVGPKPRTLCADRQIFRAVEYFVIFERFLS